MTERLISVIRDFDPYGFDDNYLGTDPAEEVKKLLQDNPYKVIEMLLGIAEDLTA